MFERHTASLICAAHFVCMLPVHFHGMVLRHTNNFLFIITWVSAFAVIMYVRYVTALVVEEKFELLFFNVTLMSEIWGTFPTWLLKVTLVES
jgi:hypothetical protein